MSSFFDASENDPFLMLIGKAVFGVALALAAPFVAFAIGRTIITASRSQSWPETKATITRSEVTTDFAVGARGPESQPIVEYRYVVGEKPYSGNQIALRSLKSRSKADADEVAAKYPIGSEHPVYYDPANPSESLLERGTSPLTYIGLGIPLVMIIVGPLMAREQIKVLRGRRGQPSV